MNPCMFPAMHTAAARRAQRRNNTVHDLERAVPELRAAGVDATWEYPGFIRAGAYSFGESDGEIAVNTYPDPLDDPDELGDLDGDLPPAKAILKFLRERATLTQSAVVSKAAPKTL